MRKTNFVIAVVVVLGLASVGWGQQCPDWAPQFDQIQSPQMRQVVEGQRQTGWDRVFQQGVAQGASLEQQIAQGESLIPGLRDNAARARQCAQQVSGGPLGHVSGAQCDNLGKTGGTATMACLCQESIANDTILATQGTIDLMKCRLGNGFHSTPTPLGGGSSSGGGRSGVDEPDSPSSSMTPMQRGANSVAGLNVAKRGDMVNSAANSWQPPTEMSNSSGSSSESAALADPFADTGVEPSQHQTPAVSDSAMAAPSSAEDSDANTQARNTSPDMAGPAPAPDNAQGWTDPLATDPSQAPSDNRQSYTPPSEAEISKSLDAGLSNSGEISATPVATVADAGNWNDFASSSSTSSPAPQADTFPSSPSESGTSQPDETDQAIDRAVQRADIEKEQLGKILPSNPISDKFIEEGTGIIGSVAHQENRIIRDFNGALSGDVTQDQLDSDVNGLRRALTDPLVPKWATDLDQKAATWQHTASRVVNKFSCMFSFDPHCK